MPCSLCHQSGHNKRTCSLATDEGMEDCEYCGYTHHYEDKCPNEATAHHYEKWRVDEEDDDETVSVVSERPKEEDEESIPEVKNCGHFFDCGCGMTVCGEYCDTDIIFRCERCDTPIINNSREHDECWCNNDDEWFCGDCKHDAMEEEEEEEYEESIPEVKDCGHFFDCGCGMTVCGECDDDMCDNEACAIYYTYRNDACMCDGCDFCEWKIRIRKSGLKLTPPFIPE